jgi:hypothetical protein
VCNALCVMHKSTGSRDWSSRWVIWPVANRWRPAHATSPLMVDAPTPPTAFGARKWLCEPGDAGQSTGADLPDVSSPPRRGKNLLSLRVSQANLMTRSDRPSGCR